MNLRSKRSDASRESSMDPEVPTVQRLLGEYATFVALPSPQLYVEFLKTDADVEPSRRGRHGVKTLTAGSWLGCAAIDVLNDCLEN